MANSKTKDKNAKSPHEEKKNSKKVTKIREPDESSDSSDTDQYVFDKNAHDKYGSLEDDSTTSDGSSSDTEKYIFNKEHLESGTKSDEEDEDDSTDTEEYIFRVEKFKSTKKFSAEETASLEKALQDLDINNDNLVNIEEVTDILKAKNFTAEYIKTVEQKQQAGKINYKTLL